MAFASLLIAGCSPEPARAPAGSRPAGPTPTVIPVPREYTRGEGTFSVSAATEVVHSGGDGAAQAANFLVQQFKGKPDFTLEVVKAGEPDSKTIAFVLAPEDASFEPEGYSLAITSKGVTIRSRTAAGSLYGAVTLWQLLTLQPAQGGVAQVPVLEIRDAPRFGWRGLMLDSARHYQSPQFIKQFIDWMALHKLNVLHWHLTDDQAWRLEIKKYPRLTSVGAWRVPAGPAAQKDIDPKTGKPRLQGGFYTQAQAREIVAYAAARNIRVVPEIEMPGHASAAIVAYPELGVPPAATQLRAVPSDWGVYENLFNVEESTFGFLEDVLTEVMDVFPGEYIHVGGDEAVKPQWEKSPRVQARMRELGVKDAHALQGYFIQRMQKFISAKGRKLIGWDEILEGDLAKEATVMSWRGVEGAITAATAGHDTVLAPSPNLYFDHWQSAGDLAPGRGDTLSLEMVYQFQPVPASIPDEQRKHILGLQANLWTEHMRTEERVVYMTFPRIAALSEVAWSPKERIVWTDFQRRLEFQLRRYDKLGIRYAREVQLNPQARRRLSHDLEPCGGGYLLSLEDDAPVDGERAVFLVNITDPCWIWRGADLNDIGTLRATVGQIPFNFQIGEDVKKIRLTAPRGDGELEIRLDGCEGEPVARVSLSPAVLNDGLTQLPSVSMGAISGTHDLCFRFTRARLDPFWVIGSVELFGK
jgi:hexosaminidase